MTKVVKEDLRAYLSVIAGCEAFSASYVLEKPPGERPGAVERIEFGLEGEESLLGYGAFAYVFCCRDRREGRLHAVKVLLKTRSTSRLQWGTSNVLAEAEIDMLEKFSSIFSNRVNAQQLREEFSTESATLIVTSYLSGRTLHDEVCKLNDLGFGPEAHAEDGYRFAATLVRDMAILLHFFHHTKAIHRDISAKNVMYHMPDDEQLFFTFIDFGLARQMERLRPGKEGEGGEEEERNVERALISPQDCPLHVGQEVCGDFGGLGRHYSATVTRVHGDGSFDLLYKVPRLEECDYGFVDKAGMGTLIPPENRGDYSKPAARTIYDERGDCWCVGALLFFVVTQGQPFSRSEALRRLEAVVPPAAREASPFDLIERLTRAEPWKRFRMKETLQHPWLQRALDPISQQVQRKIDCLRVEVEQMLLSQEYDVQAKEALVRRLITRRNSVGGSDDDDDDDELTTNQAAETEAEFSAAAAHAEAAHTGAPSTPSIKSINQARYMKRQNSRELTLQSGSPVLGMPVEPPSTPGGGKSPFFASGGKAASGSGKRERRSSPELDRGSEASNDSASDAASLHISRSSSRSSIMSTSTPRATYLGGDFVGVPLAHSLSFSSALSTHSHSRRHPHRSQFEEHEELMLLVRTRDDVQQDLDGLDDTRSMVETHLEQLGVDIAGEQQALKRQSEKMRAWRWKPLPERVRKLLWLQFCKATPFDMSDKKLADVIAALQNERAKLFGLDPEPHRAAKAGGGGRNERTEREQVDLCIFKLVKIKHVLARLFLHRRVLQEGLDRIFLKPPSNGDHLVQRVKKFLLKAREASEANLKQLADYHVTLSAMLADLQSLSVLAVQTAEGTRN